MKRCIIVDIDGTVADCGHRLAHLSGEKKSWKNFFDPALVRADGPIPPIVELITTLSNHHSIVYVSGRPESLRRVTEDWLKAHELWFDPCELHLRPHGDWRKDFIVKAEILEFLRASGWDPWLAIEDRDSVVSMWREQGLTCLQVADGNY